MTRGPDRSTRVGFEVGSGKPVDVPIRHMVVIGQTQESGKTTTLEAMIARAHEDYPDISALAFVTKRGESGFTEARRVAPYFRDRADWQFVDGLLSAVLHEKNKFLRPWIMRVCRNTHTLADVQRKVQRELGSARGISEGVYTQLDEYLKLIVPEIEQLPMMKAPQLRGGLNVMDLTAYSSAMQMLFVQSVIDWVNDNAHQTIVIVPEAWEFIPEGKGSPAKASAIDLVRKGAAIGNYIWVDTQDTAGVDKTILRGCPVWLFGVQREANEIKRNLANIPAGIAKPKASAIAQLDRGQFFACWKERAIKAYVQPAWMPADAAREIATTGETPGFPLFPPPNEDLVNRVEAEQLQRDNERLSRENEELRRRLEALERSPGREEREPERPRRGAEPIDPTDFNTDGLYRVFKERLIKELANEPRVLKVLATKHELLVDVEIEQIQAAGDTLRGRIGLLIHEGFLNDGVSGNAVQKELARRGKDPGPGNTYKELDNLALLGFLTIEQGSDNQGRPRKEYRAVPDMKININKRGGR